MGLWDRTYMREEHHSPRCTTILIVVLIAAFFVQSVFIYYGGAGPWIADWLELSVDGLRQWRLWQLFTFQFLHASPMPWHVLFNCLGLFFFGRPVEERLGWKRFLVVYLLAGLAGGIMQALSAAVLRPNLGMHLLGASAGVCGLLAIFCSFDPMAEITTLLFFFPVRIRARYLLWFVTGLSLFGTIIPWDQVAYGAHLGGILFGLAYVRWFHAPGAFSAFWSRWRSRPRAQPIVKVRFPKAQAAGVPRKSRGEDVGATDFISKEVDPILEKISAHGIHSLTERERRILEAARSKMDKE